LKNRLIWKLLFINIVVISFVMVIVWFSIDILAAGYFVTLMERYNISPEPAHAMFVDAVHRYLLWACLAAALLAAVLCYLMMRRVLAPLTRITAISRRIAAGDFNGRVPVSATDEIGQLSEAFNRMAGSLEQIENLRRNLMIDVTHELRTPLTNMRGYLEAIKDGVLSPDEKNLDLLHDETLRLADLVEDVLQLARADAAREHLVKKPLSLDPLIKEVLNGFSVRIRDKQLHVSRSVPEKMPQIHADRDRLIRILRNLTDNAVRYSPVGGELTICVTGKADAVRVLMTNTGGELNPEDIPFIFERFYRGEKSRSREHGGAGIGLSIVKELAEAHGGTVGADLITDVVRIWFEIPTATP